MSFPSKFMNNAADVQEAEEPSTSIFLTESEKYTEDMASGRPEAGSSPSRRSSSINSSTMLSINDEGNGVEECHKCSLCYKRFPQKDLLETHMDEHDEKGYQCCICNKIFKCRNSLKRHMEIHSVEKKYECDICCKRFVLKCYLKTHMAVHNKIKKYECSICNKGFTLQRSFKAHMSIHGEKKYECTICTRRFTYKRDLDRHMVVHTKEKKYECNVCETRFTKRSSIKRHMVLRHGEKNFECENIFKGKEIYQCHICDKKYELEANFKSHVLGHNEGVENETPFEFVEIPPFVKKEIDDSSYGDTSDNILDDMCDETQDRSCTIKSEVDIKTQHYFEDT